MSEKRIFLTGATGFLGSHIARKLIESNHHLILSCREKSDFTRCQDFKNKAIWINLNSPEWKSEIEKFQPEIIINIAWQGVESTSRENWSMQIENIIFQQKLLDIAEKTKVKTFIGFGSQAEYGDMLHPPEETDPVNATTAYGAIKLAALQIVKSFCEKYNINWIWLRLFSFFGEEESDNWLIPSIIKKIKENELLELTPGEQQVAYIYVKDLAEITATIIESEIPSGVYNISGDQLISIKELVTKIRNLVNPEYKLNFGTIPYRKNQPMKIIGNTDKLRKEIKFPTLNSINEGIKRIIEFNTN